MSDETPNTAPTPDAALSAAPDQAPVTDAPAPESVTTSPEALNANPSPVQGLTFEQAIALAERIAAAQAHKAPPVAPQPPPVLPEVALLERFERDGAARAEIVRQMMVNGDPANPAHVAIVNQALRAEAKAAQQADQFKTFENRFAELQAQQAQQALAHRVDTAFAQTLGNYADVPAPLQNLLAAQSALLIQQGHAPEQAIKAAFAQAAPLLRLRGQPGRPNNAQAAIRGNDQAKAVVGAQANGAGRLVNTRPMAQMSKPERAAHMAKLRSSIWGGN